MAEIVPKMKRYLAPNGTPIVGVLETIPATAMINGIGFSADGEVVEYAGDSTVHWDDQKAVKREGGFVYLDEDGEEWAFIQLVEVEEDRTIEPGRILWTLDGEKRGNGIVVGPTDREDTFLCETDFGNEMRLNTNEVMELYRLGPLTDVKRWFDDRDLLRFKEPDEEEPS